MKNVIRSFGLAAVLAASSAAYADGHINIDINPFGWGAAMAEGSGEIIARAVAAITIAAGRTIMNSVTGGTDTSPLGAGGIPM